MAAAEQQRSAYSSEQLCALVMRVAAEEAASTAAPASMTEALAGADSAEWQRAASGELLSIVQTFGAAELVPKEDWERVIRSRFVLSVKLGAAGERVFKARLVAQEQPEEM